MPKPRRIEWTKNARTRLARAVRKYNDVITSWESRSFDEIPRHTSVQREMRKIENYEELEKRIFDLESITYAGSDVPVMFRGKIVPDYMVQLIEDLELEVDEERRANRDKLYKDWDKLSPQKRAEARIHTNIDLLNKDEVSAEYQEALEEERLSEKDANYIANYESEWMDLAIDKKIRDEVVEDLEWIYENSPGALKYLTKRGDEETVIEYIYLVSAYQESFENRKRHIQRYWKQVREHLESGLPVEDFVYDSKKD